MKVDQTKPMVQLSMSFGNIVVPFMSVEAVLKQRDRVWSVQRTDIVMELTGSKNAMILSGLDSWVSADHCQNGTMKVLYELKVVVGYPLDIDIDLWGQPCSRDAMLQDGTETLRNRLKTFLNISDLDAVLQGVYEKGTLAGIAGSAVLQSVMGTVWDDSDVDFWVVDARTPELGKFIHAAQPLHEVLHASGYRITGEHSYATNNSDMGSYHRLRNTIKRIISYKKKDAPNLQIMLVRRRIVQFYPNHPFPIGTDKRNATIQAVVSSFDINICQFWYDGMDVLCHSTPVLQSVRKRRMAIVEGCAHVQSGNEWKRTFHRISKYRSRGFEFDAKSIIPILIRTHNNSLDAWIGMRKLIRYTCSDVFSIDIRWKGDYVFVNIDTKEKKVIHCAVISIREPEFYEYDHNLSQEPMVTDEELSMAETEIFNRTLYTPATSISQRYTILAIQSETEELRKQYEALAALATVDEATRSVNALSWNARYPP
jgi:hypothetical protein